MCGITLSYSKNNHKKNIFVDAGLDLMIHRGQDNKSICHINENLSVGHRRLSITGELGIQPIHYDGIYILTNGEFYDYKDILNQYPNYIPLTDSDAEILIPLYKDSLDSLLKAVHGEFVFIIIDTIKKELIIARDRLGNKSLYYIHDNNEFFIASEIKAFKSIKKLEFNTDVLNQKLSMQYHNPSQTLFKDIKQVEPGTFLRYNYETNELKVHIYDDLYKNINSQELDSKEIFKLLKESVARRIDKQNPALTLSGGLDSSIILDLVQEINPNINECFSISFTDGGIYDEQKIVKVLAKKYNLKLNLIKVSNQDLINNFEESLYYAEDIAVNMHMPAKFLLFKEINKKGYRVSLSGEGSDEFFLGYSHFYPLKENYLTGMHLPDKNVLKSNNQKLPLFLEAKLSIGYKIQSLLKNKLTKITIDCYETEHLDPISRASYLWSKYSLSNSILVALGDKMEMASTIEGRTPFLDKDLLNYIMALKIEDKQSLTEDKTLLREIFRNRLPPEVINKPKHPFLAPPLIETTIGMDFIQKTLNEWKTDLLDRNKINDLITQLKGINDPNLYRLYDPVFMILSSLALLQKRFIDD